MNTTVRSFTVSTSPGPGFAAAIVLRAPTITRRAGGATGGDGAGRDAAGCARYQTAPAARKARETSAAGAATPVPPSVSLKASRLERITRIAATNTVNRAIASQ